MEKKYSWFNGRVALKKASSSDKLAKEQVASPSPSGRRWPEGSNEGGNALKISAFRPHPPLRGTLSRRERDLAKNRLPIR
jgi:hypothetical protein